MFILGVQGSQGKQDPSCSAQFQQGERFLVLLNENFLMLRLCNNFHIFLEPNMVWHIKLIYVGSSAHPEGICVLIISTTSTMRASHCLYRSGWIQWHATQDTVTDCLLVTKPPVGSGPPCITPGLGYYYSWRKTLRDTVPTHPSRLLERPRRSSLAQAGRNCRGQQTDREKVPELLKDLLTFPADRTAGEQDWRQGPSPLVSVWICWDLLKCERGT